MRAGEAGRTGRRSRATRRAATASRRRPQRRLPPAPAGMPGGGRPWSCGERPDDAHRSTGSRDEHLRATRAGAVEGRAAEGVEVGRGARRPVRPDAVAERTCDVVGPGPRALLERGHGIEVLDGRCAAGDAADPGVALELATR